MGVFLYIPVSTSTKQMCILRSYQMGFSVSIRMNLEMGRGDLPS
jgi:hypothetical protein